MLESGLAADMPNAGSSGWSGCWHNPSWKLSGWPGCWYDQCWKFWLAWLLAMPHIQCSGLAAGNAPRSRLWPGCWCALRWRLWLAWLLAMPHPQSSCWLQAIVGPKKNVTALADRQNQTEAKARFSNQITNLKMIKGLYFTHILLLLASGSQKQHIRKIKSYFIILRYIVMIFFSHFIHLV